ncbi:hypothetical protein [Vibrio coralliilyticus]|uniref:hypothetical protein n=1 Tax=Vibrio coralliilyticus TaxID=190893 RepID=UPI0015606EBC|nr:hypothetical protein [Vibrio coralliilyticus]NRF17531.1 hypothetical protein [Vibrio coralliilyticus]
MNKKIDKVIWPWVILAIFLGALVSIYVYRFHEFDWSKTPSDWGTIGDYFGGLLNPVVSALALYFLIKAYLTQKEELSETREVLKQTAESNKEVSESQKKLLKTQYLTSLINSEYQRVDYLYRELERCTEAIVNNRNTIDRDGNELNSGDSAKRYRKNLIRDIAKINDKLKKLNEELAVIDT